MSRVHGKNSSMVLDKIKEAENLRTDAELAIFLGKDPSTISIWRKNNTLDWDTIFKKCQNMDFDELIKSQYLVEDSQIEYGIEEYAENDYEERLINEVSTILDELTNKRLSKSGQYKKKLQIIEKLEALLKLRTSQSNQSQEDES